MTGTGWDLLLDSLADSFKNHLSCLNHKDLVSFCVEKKEIRIIIEDYLKKHAKKPKSVKNNDLALLKKNQGNLKFQEKKYKESLSFYNDSISHADQNDETLSLAYSNRSLVLLQMGYITESLQDIEMALSCGYPKSKMGKLIIRKAKCLVKLGEIEKAKQILNQGLQENYGKEIHVSIKQELRNLRNVKNKNLSKLDEFHLPEPVNGENENFTSASSHLSVFFSSDKGRHVIATEDIKIGDVLFVEKPFAFVLFKELCHCCCKKVVAPIPCANCLDVFYCSSKCRDDFWKLIHSFECGYGNFFKSIGIAHLSLRIILKVSSNLLEFKNIVNEFEELKLKEGIISYKNNIYQKVFHLVPNTEKFESHDLFQYVVTAFLLALYLKNYTSYFPKISGDEELKFLTSIISRHILQMICNGHAIIDTFLQKSNARSVINVTEERVGVAVYPSASMMNHSCMPSIINSFYKNYLIVRAAKNIKKGDEVFNCYGPHASRMPRIERQEILTNQYFFKCECEACLQLIDKQEILEAFKCNNCKGPLIIRQENKNLTFCISCQRIGEVLPEVRKKQNTISSLISEGNALFDQYVNCALEKFLQAWLLAREVYYKFNKDLSYIADEIARCLAALEEYKKTIMFLKCCILSTEYRFGHYSIELAIDLRKIGDAITSYVVQTAEKETREIATQGIIYYKKAKNIIGLLYGLHNPDLEEIDKNIMVLEEILKNYKHL